MAIIRPITRLVAQSATVSGGVSEAPAWFEALDALKWTEIGEALEDSAVSGLPPAGGGSGSRASCFAAWTGPVMDTDLGEMLFVAQQGHGDGSYNGSFGFRLLEDTPQWRVYFSSNGQNDSGNGTSSDGGCCSSHSYGMQAYCPLDGKVYLPGRGATSTGGNYRPLIASWQRTGGVRGFDTTTFGPGTAWTAGSVGSDRSQDAYSDWCPLTETVVSALAFSNSGAGLGMMSVDPVSEAVVFSGTTIGSGSGNPVLRCAGSHGVAVILFDNGSVRVWNTQDLADGVQLTTTPSGAPTLNEAPDLVWHEASDAFLARGGTSKNLYKLRPADWGSPFTSWSWTEVTTDAAGVTPDAHYAAGSHGKFRIVPDMGNGEACLVLIPQETSVPLVMRLTGGL